jgi:intraflagellar transport protein 74
MPRAHVQVQDRSYFTGLLRTKVGDITDELHKLKGEIENSEKDTSTYSQLERKYENLIKEVRGLEGNLADYNLAMDKLRSSQDPLEVQQYCNQLKEKNQNDALQV